jgi:hypothetical protein
MEGAQVALPYEISRVLRGSPADGAEDVPAPLALCGDQHVPWSTAQPLVVVHGWAAVSESVDAALHQGERPEAA